MRRTCVAMAGAAGLALSVATPASARLTRCDVDPVGGSQRGIIQVTGVRVSGVGCRVAASVIREFLGRTWSTAERKPVRVQGFAVTVFRRRHRGAVFHAHKPGRNIYFTVRLNFSRDFPEFLTLIRAIPVNRDIGKARLVSVSLYTDGVIVEWAVRGPHRLPSEREETRGRLDDDVRLSVSDDVRTRYHTLRGAAGGSSDLIWGEEQLTPPVPPTARHLYVRINRAVFDVPLAPPAG